MPGVCDSPCLDVTVVADVWTHAGYDQYHPFAKTGENMAPKGMGWIIIDSFGHHDADEPNEAPASRSGMAVKIFDLGAGPRCEHV